MSHKESNLKAYKRLLITDTNYIVFGFIHFFFSGLGQSFLIGSFKTYFIGSISLWDNTIMSNSDFAYIYMACTILSGFTILFVGPIVDKIKIQHASITAGTLLILFTIIISRTSSFWFFAISLFGIRFCGQGLLPLIGSTAIARHYDKDRGKAISLTSIGVSFSEAILAPVIGSLLYIWDWQNVWQLLGVLISLVFIPLVIFLINKNDKFQFAPSQRTKRGKLSKNRKAILRDYKFYVLLVNYIFPPFLFTGLVINADLFENLQHYDPLWFIFCIPAFGITRSLTTITIGPIIDKYTAVKVFPFNMIPLIIGIIIIHLSNEPWLLFVFTALFGVTMGINGTSSSAMWVELYGPSHLASIKSLTSTMMILATSISVPIFNWLLSSYNSSSYTLIPTLIIIIIISTASFLLNSTFQRKSI